MPPNTRNYSFDFYVIRTLASDPRLPALTAGDLFSRICTRLTSSQPTSKEIAGASYEVRFIEPTTFGFRGTIAKHRPSDLPHAAIVGGNEREIDLAPNENLIEKASFHYYHGNNLLIMQRHHFCIGATNFGRYLSEDGYVSSLNPVIKNSDLNLLMSGSNKVKKLNIEIARPTNPELFSRFAHDFNNSLFQTLNGTASARVNVSLRGNTKSKDKAKRYLLSDLKDAVLETIQALDVKKCKIELEDEDTLVSHPIDLIADRLSFKKSIQTNGRYPPQNEIWQALVEAKSSLQDELDQYFGMDGSNRLI